MALLLGILPLVADQRGGFFFSAGIGRGAGLDRRPADPDVGPGAKSPVVRTLRVVGAVPKPRGAAPRCPACPAGVPISPEKWGERGPGASPLDPIFMAARSHSLGLGIVVSDPFEGLFPPVC